MSQSLPRPTILSSDLMATTSHDQEGSRQMKAELCFSAQAKQGHVPTQHQDPPNATKMCWDKDPEVIFEQTQASTSHSHQALSGPSLRIFQCPHLTEGGKLANLKPKASSSYIHSHGESTSVVHNHNAAADLQAASPRVPDNAGLTHELLLHVDVSKGFGESRHTSPDMVLSSRDRTSDGYEGGISPGNVQTFHLSPQIEPTITIPLTYETPEGIRTIQYRSRISNTSDLGTKRHPG